MVLNIDLPRRQLLQILPNGFGIRSPWPEISSKGMQDQYPFDLSSLTAARKLGRNDRPNQQTDTQTGNKTQPGWVSRCHRGASIHPRTRLPERLSCSTFQCRRTTVNGLSRAGRDRRPKRRDPTVGFHDLCASGIILSACGTDGNSPRTLPSVQSSFAANVSVTAHSLPNTIAFHRDTPCNRKYSAPTHISRQSGRCPSPPTNTGCARGGKMEGHMVRRQRMYRRAQLSSPQLWPQTLACPVTMDANLLI